MHGAVIAQRMDLLSTYMLLVPVATADELFCEMFSGCSDVNQR